VGRFENAAKNLFWTWTTAILRSALVFVTAIYTYRHFGSERMGFLLFALAVAEIPKLLTSNWRDRVWLRGVGQDRDRTDALWTAGLLVTLVVAGAATVVTGAVVWWLPLVPWKQTVLWVCLLGGFVNTLDLQVFFDAWGLVRYGTWISSLRQMVRAAGAALVIFVWVSYDVTWLAVATLVGQLVYVLTSYVVFCGRVHALRIEPDRDTMRQLLREGRAIFLPHLVRSLARSTDVWAIKIFVGDAALGIYGAAKRLLDPLRIFWVSLVRVTHPLVLAAVRRSQDETRRMFEFEIRALSLMALPLAVCGMAMAGPVVALLYTDEYAPTVIPLMILCARVVPEWLGGRFLQLLYAYGKDRLYGAALWVGMGSSVVLCLGLAPLAGVTGVAAALLGSSTIVAVTCYVLSRRVLRVPMWQWVSRPLLGSAIAAGIGVLATPWVAPAVLVPSVGVGCMILCLALRPFSREQEQRIRELFRRRPAPSAGPELDPGADVPASGG